MNDIGFAQWIATEDSERLWPLDQPLHWNPFNKVVQDHRDGTIDMEMTDRERSARGLPVPWTPEIGSIEVHQPPVF